MTTPDRMYRIIKRQVITEKAADDSGRRNAYHFAVPTDANKIEIKRAVEAQFDRKVAEVRVVSMHGKERRQGRYVGHKPNWKKAYVRLAAGEKSIEFFEGV